MIDWLVINPSQDLFGLRPQNEVRHEQLQQQACKYGQVLVGGQGISLHGQLLPRCNAPVPKTSFVNYYGTSHDSGGAGYVIDTKSNSLQPPQCRATRLCLQYNYSRNRYISGRKNIKKSVSTSLFEQFGESEQNYTYYKRVGLCYWLSVSDHV